MSADCTLFEWVGHGSAHFHLSRPKRVAARKQLPLPTPVSYCLLLSVSQTLPSCRIPPHTRHVSLSFTCGAGINHSTSATTNVTKSSNTVSPSFVTTVDPSVKPPAQSSWWNDFSSCLGTACLYVKRLHSNAYVKYALSLLTLGVPQQKAESSS